MEWTGLINRVCSAYSTVGCFRAGSTRGVLVWMSGECSHSPLLYLWGLVKKGKEPLPLDDLSFCREVFGKLVYLCY